MQTRGTLWITYRWVGNIAVFCGVFNMQPEQEDLKSFGQFATPLATAGFVRFVPVISDLPASETN